MKQKPETATAPEGTENASNPASASARIGIGRRGLLRGGAAAAPVLLTLHSGPVAATGSMACTVASSFVSVATFASRNPGATTMQCSSMNAGHWHANAKACAPLVAHERPRWATTKLTAYLGRSCSIQTGLNSNPDSYEIWQVMGLGSSIASTGELGVLHHILGLALSIDNGGGIVNTGGRMNTPYLAEIWRNYKSNGRYMLPAGGVSWTEAELIGWLKMLQYPVPVPSV